MLFSYVVRKTYLSPLEQFDNTFGLCKAAVTFFAGLPTWISSFGLQVLLALLAFSAIFPILQAEFYGPTTYKPVSGFRFCVVYIKFLLNLAKSNLGSYVWTPLIFFVFNTILFFNLVGLLPFTTTVFAQLVATLSLSAVVYGGALIQYIAQKKLRSIEIFLPSGTPLFIAPLLILIEVVSVTSRVISLSVRLFANLTAGHILLKILSTFFLLLVANFTNVFMFGAGTVLLIVVMAVTVLETMICILQTYVYITLVLLYIHELETGH
jgi:F-type H+-transporting ATPase subunit a